MTTIKVDDIDYDVESLSEDAKAQLASLQATEKRILETQEDLAILQTARNAYFVALKGLLE